MGRNGRIIRVAQAFGARLCHESSFHDVHWGPTRESGSSNPINRDYKTVPLVAEFLVEDSPEDTTRRFISRWSRRVRLDASRCSSSGRTRGLTMVRTMMRWGSLGTCRWSRELSKRYQHHPIGNKKNQQTLRTNRAEGGQTYKTKQKRATAASASHDGEWGTIWHNLAPKANTKSVIDGETTHIYGTMEPVISLGGALDGFGRSPKWLGGAIICGEYAWK